MAATETLLDRFRRMPRAIQWLAGLGGLVIVALVFLDMQDVRKGLDEEARAIEEKVRSVGSVDALITKDLEDTVVSVGAIDLPGSDRDGGEALNRIVNELAKKYKLGTSGSFTIRPDRRLPSETLPQLGRLETIKGDLSFESSPDDATAIIAALESDPAVECVRSLRITKSGPGKVKVRLVLEAWVRSAAGLARESA